MSCLGVKYGLAIECREGVYLMATREGGDLLGRLGSEDRTGAATFDGVGKFWICAMGGTEGREGHGCP